MTSTAVLVKRLPFLHFHIVLCFLIFSCTTLMGQSNQETWQFADTPDWVTPRPRPDLSKPASPASFAQNETYYLHDKSVHEYYFKRYYYVGDPELHQYLKRFKVNYEPDDFRVLLHEAKLWRKGKLVVDEQQLATEHSLYEEKVGEDSYETHAWLTMVFSKLRLGDWVEIAFTIRGRSGDWKDHINYRFLPEEKVDYSENYFQLWVPKTLPFTCKVLYALEDTQIRYEGEYAILECELFVEKLPNSEGPADLNTPWPQMLCNDFSSLTEQVDLNLENFKVDAPVAPIVQEKTKLLTKQQSTLGQKIDQVLRFVQSEIDYMDYDLIKPKSAPTVLKQGFGDCKSKSLLTIKMLKSLGVEAWPVLVVVKGIDSVLVHRSNYMPWDHCIMEYVFAGDTLAFDATKELQRGPLAERQTDAYGYGLRLIEGNNSLTKFDKRSKRKETIEATISPADKDHHIDFNIDITLEGRAADLAVAKYQRFGAEEVWWNYKSDLFNEMSFTRKEDKLSFSFEEEGSFAILKPTSFRSLPKTTLINQNSNDFYTAYLFHKLRLPEHLSKHSSFRTPDFGRIDQIFKLVGDKSLSIKPDTIEIKKDWINYFRRVWKSEDTLYAHYSAEILKDIIPNERYQELKADVDSIQQTIDPKVGYRTESHARIRPMNEIIAEEKRLRLENKRLEKILWGAGLFMVMLVIGIGFRFLFKRHSVSKG